jgi:hypothetical protein
MEFRSNNKAKNRRYFNITFLGIFLFEIIIGLIGIFILPTKTENLISSVFVTFIFGIYTVSNINTL